MPAVGLRSSGGEVLIARSPRRRALAIGGRLCGLLLLVCAILVIPGVSPSGAPLDSARVIPTDAPALAADGAGGAFIGWQESGGGVVQHVDPTGARRWPGGGVRRGPATTTPRLAADGAGGVLVAWLDDASALHVERLGDDGTSRWSSVGGSPAVAGASFGLAADGAGGALVAWEAADGALVAQHVDGQGTATWSRTLAAGGVAVRGSLATTDDGAGGLAVAFATEGAGGGDGPIVLHRLAADGAVRDGVEVAPRAATSGALAIAAAPAGGVVIAWAAREGGAVRAQYVDAGGRSAWTPGGVSAAEAAIAPADVGVAVDGVGGTTLTWQDARDQSAGCPEDCVSRTQRLRPDGSREWGADGRELGTLPAFGPRVATVGQGVVAAWQQCPTPACAGAAEVRVERLVPAAAPLTVGDAAPDSRLALIGDGASGAIVAWWDCASVCEVRTRRIALDGASGFAALQVGPDLVVAALTAPLQAAPGQTFVVANTVRNIGDAAAVPFRIGFYLSSDPTADPTATGSTPIGVRHVTGLTPGGSSAVPTPVTIPTDAAAGRTFLVAVVDDLKEVDEGPQEGNNIRSVALTIVKPDLVVSSVTAPTTGTIGGTLAISTSVRNITTGAVSVPFTVGLFLSANASVDPAIDRRVGSRIINGLAGNGTSAGSTTVNIPPDLVPGSYFVGAIADVDHVVPEGNTSNNTRVAATRTAFPVRVTSFTPTMGPVGTTVTITGTSLPAVHEVRFFNGVNVSDFTVLPPVTVKTTVPSGATTGPITFAFTGGTASSTASFRVSPRIVSFAPAIALVGDTVTITGTTLSGAAIKIGAAAVPATDTATTDTQAVIKVPSTARTGRLTVTTTGGTATSATDLIVVRPPRISSFTPAAAPVGAAVTITGDQFAAASDVTFTDGVSAGPPTVLTPTSIRTIVPTGAVTGRLSVTNPAGTAQSTGIFRVAPRITGFSPLSGLPGANVSITGTTLAAATAVRFGSVMAVIGSNTAEEIVVTVPPTAPTGRITVVTADGQSMSPTEFLVIRPPTIASFSPAAAAVGASVTISGTNLASATAVTFNDVPVVKRIVLSNTAIRVSVPDGATTGLVKVTNAAGSATSRASFKVLPAITGLSPSAGFIGSTVTITGTTFTGLESVKFGAVPAAVSSPPTDSEIVVTVPGDARTAPVIVKTAAGTATSATPFEVIRPPTITAFTPPFATTGKLVVIDGDSVGSATAVTFNRVSATTFTRISSTRIQATVPLLATTGPIGITNPAGSVLSTVAFRVIPNIAAFTPSTGPVGTAVTITGSGFVGLPIVRFGAIQTEPTSVSLTAVVAPVPPRALTGFITVTTSEGTGNSSTRFTVIQPPTLESFSPTVGAGNTSVLLVGTNLTTATTVRFNGIVAATTTANASATTRLRAVVPVDATTGRITVTNEAGTVTSAADFHVLPTVTGFSPPEGAAGTVVTITGHALNETTAVRFGGVAASFAPSNASQVVAIVPATAVTGPITVTTIEGSAASADDFDVLGPMATAGLSRRRLDLRAPP